jgi:HAD superfamily hydrolase (TIGR01549 family)
MNSSILDKYEVIIFDCDGVIMDVNLLKCEAFGKAVEEYSEDVIRDFVEYCKNSFGISRYVKFKDFFSKFANEPFDEKKYQVFLDRYAAECLKIYALADFTLGCEELLSKLQHDRKTLYIASGSDELELNEAFKDRGIHHYFKSIYGSPKTKSDCTSEILAECGNKNIVFIGDALSDMKTAKEHEIDFVYMSNYSVQSTDQNNKCVKEAVKCISTLQDLI